MRYRIIYRDEAGYAKSKVLATALEGQLIKFIENFDECGSHLALVEFPNEQIELAASLLTSDKSVISYRNTKYV